MRVPYVPWPTIPERRHGHAPYHDPYQEHVGLHAGHPHKFYRRPFDARSPAQREPLNVGEIMTSPVTCVRPEAPLRDVAQLMRDEDVGILPVVGPGNRLFGVITDRDIVTRAVVRGDLTGGTAGDVMSTDLCAMMPKEPLTSALAMMADRGIHRMPVVDRHGRLLGILSFDDVVNRADRDQEREVIGALRAVAGRRRFWTGR